MAETPATFSESWHRVASQRIRLRPGVKVRRQFFRGELWYVLEDPFTNQFFRLRPSAHAFIARFDGQRTVQEAWQGHLDADADNAPGQEEVIRLLSQLYAANLLQYESPGDSAALADRQRKRRERETAARWLNIMFLRIPLVDPDRFLDALMPLWRIMFSTFGALVWLGVVGWAVKVGIDNFPQLVLQTEGVLAPGNLPLLYLGMAIIKALHELGHSAACKRFGGEVHVLGVMLLIFTPVPYMDATASWGFRSRWHRMLVGAAGMIVEIFVAAIALFLWANTSPGLLHSLAYNMIFIASVSTVLFNANPLLRYDGYYMLSDFLEIPNLAQRANLQLKYFAEKYLFGARRVDPPSRVPKEQALLAFFGVASHIYRVIVFAGILLFVADRFLLLGAIMAVACLVSWIVVPIVKLWKYLATSPSLERCRSRAIGVTIGIAAAIILILEVIPFPNHFRAPGILEARERAEVVNDVSGYMEKLMAEPGSRVTNGQPLLVLRNPELELDFQAANARFREATAIRLMALQQTNSANLKPADRRLESVRQQLDRLERDREALVVRAREEGVWVAPEVKDYLGRWVPRGADFGLVINAATYIFKATVPQTDVSSLFDKEVRSATIRIHGEAGSRIEVSNIKVIQAGQRRLPSAALGYMAGGDMAVSHTDPEGRQTTEPFFEVLAEVKPGAATMLLDGRSGKIRFRLPPEPLLHQWFRRLRQLLQQRYQW